MLVAAAGLTGCEERVVSALAVASVEVSPAEITLVEGDRATASATVRERGGRELSGREVTWSVDDGGVATVNSAGLVEGRGPGSTLIHATSEGVTGSATVSVLPGPIIQLSATALVFDGVQGDPAILESELEVNNGGGGSLSGLSVSVRGADGGSATWLEAQLLGGTAPTRLRIRATAEHLSVGTHDAVVSVQSPVARNGPVDVSVRLNVGPPPQPESCVVSNRTFGGDVEIPEDTSCIFANVRVRGDLKLRRGAALTGTDVRVDGNVEARQAARLSLSTSRVDGSLEFERGGGVDLRRTEIDGNLLLDSNSGRLEAEDNRIEGNVQLSKNRGGPFVLSDNRIDGNLQCTGNEPPPTGGGNVVGGNKEGQCRNL